MTDTELDALERILKNMLHGKSVLSRTQTIKPDGVLKLIAELRQATAERDWVIEQIITGYSCPPFSDENEDDCDKQTSCEDCWLQAAKEAACQK